ncbi:MAG: response regulator [Planctomycetota bacterium]
MPEPADDTAQNWADKKIFTTGEAAQVCKVSQQTIIRCFDSGRLRGFRVPGSKFRRIPRDELMRFMRSNSIPLENLEGDRKRILVVDDDDQITGLIRDLLGRDGRFEIETAATGYDAGRLTESFRPHLIVLDYLLPDINGTLVCRRIRESDRSSQIRVLCISGVVNQAEVDDLMQAGADAFMRKPFDIDELGREIEKLLGAGSEASAR